jgi:NADPH:quinone reductase-like Zn-dependent oxidoreductase
MNAAIVHTLGTAPQCELFPEPIADANEVIVHVHAASLKPVDRQIVSGSHYATPHEVPFICGTDGVGHLPDGQRVFFGGCPAPLRRDGATDCCTKRIRLSRPRRR